MAAFRPCRDTSTRFLEMRGCHIRAVRHESHEVRAIMIVLASLRDDDAIE